MNKPLKDWTLAETKAYCQEHSDCAGCVFRNEDECLCKLQDGPAPMDWDIDDGPHFSYDDVATIKHINRYQKISKLSRAPDGCLSILFEQEGCWAFPRGMFPGLHPGQSVTLADIVGRNED